MLEYTIQNVEEQDLNQLIILDNSINPTSVWGYDDYKRLIDSGLCEIVGAFKKERLIAFVVFFLLKNDFEIISVVTEKEYRRQGIARTLFHFVLACAKERNIERVFLEVRFSNIYARDLYKKLGFEEVGIRKHYYVDPDEDGILYTLYVQSVIPNPLEKYKK
ncbi:MAG: ribosomal protein S18-alanine N-acetyltransferase [Desulfovibrionaceae bacterium]